MNVGLQEYCLNLYCEHIPETFSLNPALHFDENYEKVKNFWREFTD